MRISNASNGEWLSFLMRDPTTGAVIVDLTYADVSAYVMYPAGSPITTPLPVTDGTFRNCERGVYQIFVSGDYFSTVGELIVLLFRASDGTVSARNDEIVNDQEIVYGQRVTLWIQDEESEPITDAVVQVRDSTSAVVVAQVYSGADGSALTFLPTGAYKVYVRRVGFTFDNPYSITVSGDQSNVLTGQEFVPASPSSGELARVYGFLTDSAGEPRVGVTLAFRPVYRHATHRTADVVVTLREKTVVTDALGAFSIDLIPTSDLLPAGARYVVTIRDEPEEQVYVNPTTAGQSYDITALL